MQRITELLAYNGGVLVGRGQKIGKQCWQVFHYKNTHPRDPGMGPGLEKWDVVKTKYAAIKWLKKNSYASKVYECGHRNVK